MNLKHYHKNQPSETSVLMGFFLTSKSSSDR